MQTVIRPEESRLIGEVKGQESVQGEFKSSRRGKVTIFVSSQRVYKESRLVSFPSFAGGLGPGSNLTFQPKRVVLYEDILDHEQREALENSIALAKNLGVKLEVKDLGKSNVFRKLVNVILGTKTPSKTPSMSISGEALYLLAKRKPADDLEHEEEECLVKPR